MDDRIVDRVVSALTNVECRQICQYLVERDDSSATLYELVGVVNTETRSDSPSSAPPPDSDVRLRTELHHLHLPKLEAACIIEYHSERRVVEASPALPVAGELARAINDADHGSCGRCS